MRFRGSGFLATEALVQNGASPVSDRRSTNRTGQRYTRKIQLSMSFGFATHTEMCVFAHTFRPSLLRLQNDIGPENAEVGLNRVERFGAHALGVCVLRSNSVLRDRQS
jgi:hypothetical protein